MSNFTPVPWKLDGEFVTASGYYEAPRVFSHADPDKPKFIAEIAVCNSWEENGNLISAAPEMHRALNNLIVYWDTQDDDMDLLLRIVKEGRAALAKAEGK